MIHFSRLLYASIFSGGGALRIASMLPAPLRALHQAQQHEGAIGDGRHDDHAPGLGPRRAALRLRVFSSIKIAGVLAI